MSVPYSVGFFGADENYTSGAAGVYNPTVTELGVEQTANPDFNLSVSSVDAYGMFLSREAEGDNDTFLDNTMSTITTYRDGFKVRVKAKAFPLQSAPVVSLESYAPFLLTLQKPYLWVRSNNFPLGFITTSTTQAVVVSGFETIRVGSFYIFEIDLKFVNATNTG